ncbi:TIGR01906 family membrane protein [Lactococcus garvieae]|jgi:integral membrane protein (TIGR01906 family)|uniref:TIGR01906 family membrane protein n=1 Tax=Lactococcus garvieae TaxID=1363 RepID=UPI0009C03FDA|nr:TIGR01906 family membrane protein [Lactococcus garvieae]QPS71676.1 TIGR01906 family membrane protein [Lactococcus garvieae]
MRDRLIFTSLILWGTATAVCLTLLLAVPLFYADIHLENLTNVSGLPAETLRHNFNVLMAYLVNPFVSSLHMPDFPSSPEALKHFSDVKRLFLFAIGLMILLSPGLILFLKEHLAIVYHNGLRFVMGTPLFIGLVAALIGFDNFFIYFHQIFFRDDTWLFNPDTDPIINVLTENYFMVTFIIFLVVFELIFFLLYWMGNKRMQTKFIGKSEH